MAENRRFHIAEEITQDTFLKVYERLHTLKDPNQFSGWLYVIATRRCYAWFRKKRIRTQPLEDADIPMIRRDAYSRHVADERTKTVVEAQREVVKRLLSKLKESERTVMTLYYLGEMTVEEISKFLGVSAGTIKSRLQRARNRLQKEETVIRDALEHFHISPNLTDNIMREVSRLKPIAPSGSKPLVPWVMTASSAILIVLMLGIGRQYLSYFQKPYSLDAQAEMTVELVEASVVVNLDTEPDFRRQLGNSNAFGKIDNNGQKVDVDLLAAAQSEGEDISVAKQQWIQFEPIVGSKVHGMFPTPEGELYVLGGSRPSIFKLSNDEKEWQHIVDISLLDTAWTRHSPIAKWKNTLYFIPSHELFASKDDGKTWDSVYSWTRKYDSVQLVLTDQAFYIAFENSIFRSKDAGKTWKAINDGLMDGINSIVINQNTLFAGTDDGLYRLNGDNWQRLDFPVTAKMIRSVASADEKLYVAAELNDDMLDSRKVALGVQRSWWIFRSTDLGNSWTDITPTDVLDVKRFPPHFKLVASGETLLAIPKGMMVRSTDSGDTWMSIPEPGTAPSVDADVDVAVVVNENNIYVESTDEGLHLSTDRGKTWKKVNFSPVSRVDNLVLFKGNSREKTVSSILYARTGGTVRKTTNQGKSWNIVQQEIFTAEFHKEEPYMTQHAFAHAYITHILKYGSVIYAKGYDAKGGGKIHIYRMSKEDDKTIIPIQGMPIFDSNDSPSGAFTVSNDTFYMEHNYKLFQWEPGDTEWYDTGIEETAELSTDIARRDLKLAASGNTVYVGKRDGHLVVSFDKGNNWTDLTSALPFAVKTFNDIVVAGSTVYAATDAGVTTSDNRKKWRVVTDAEGTNLIMEHLTVDGNTLYGVTNKTGFYRLESGTWEQVISEKPEGVTSLVVDGNTLYVGTESSGILHFNFEN